MKGKDTHTIGTPHQNFRVGQICGPHCNFLAENSGWSIPILLPQVPSPYFSPSLHSLPLEVGPLHPARQSGVHCKL